MIIMHKLAAVVILYNPPQVVLSNIKSYMDYMDKIYVIDNSEHINSEIITELKGYSKIEYINNHENLGISIPLNMALNRAKANYNYLMTMDQDSAFEPQYIKKYIEQINIMEQKDVISLSPYLQIKNDPEKVDVHWCYVRRCMTSGNIININKSLEIGGFDETLFIDEVDHEFCCRIKEYGYQIVQFDSGIYMKHALGERCKYVFFQYRQHDYRRVYYIIRNKLIVGDKHPSLKVRYRLSVIKKILKIIIFENDKIMKLKSVKEAIKDYCDKNFGKKTFYF